MKNLFFLIFLLLFCKAGRTQTLSLIEQKMLKDIEANMPATIQLLKESVNINSGTYNTEGVKKVEYPLSILLLFKSIK